MRDFGRSFLSRALLRCSEGVNAVQHRLPMPLYSFVQRVTLDLAQPYLPWPELAARWRANRGMALQMLGLDDLARRRTSDTLVFLGSNRSILDLDEAAWATIRQFDTFGWNYWLYHDFTPTYYTIEYGFMNAGAYSQVKDLFRRRRTQYANTVFFFSTRARRRGMHPRTFPELFAEPCTACCYLYPKRISCPATQPFTTAHFRDSFLYRGSMTLYLRLAMQMGYRRMILVGCEMDNAIPFYEYLPEAAWMQQLEGYQTPREQRARQLYAGAIPSETLHGLAEVILAINELAFKPRGIELYVGSPKSLLHPAVPVFKLS